MTRVEALRGSGVEAKVLQADRSAVLDFYQESCPPCHALTPRLERIAREYAGRISVYRVDVDEDMAVAERFEVMSLPTLLVLKVGEEVARLDGLVKEEDLRRAIAETLDD